MTNDELITFLKANPGFALTAKRDADRDELITREFERIRRVLEAVGVSSTIGTDGRGRPCVTVNTPTSADIVSLGDNQFGLKRGGAEVDRWDAEYYWPDDRFTQGKGGFDVVRKFIEWLRESDLI